MKCVAEYSCCYVYNMADKDSTDLLSGGSQPNNPLSRKLNKILETRLDNDKVLLWK